MPYFKFGTCTVPDGRCGPWEISTFTLTDDDVRLENIRSAFSGAAYAHCHAGTYKRLKHDRRGVVMSNTPMEIRTALAAYQKATGRVLVTGLGLGMVLEGILSKPEVTSVRVMEIDPDVIALTGPHFADSRVEIIQADAYAYKPAKSEAYDFIWHDIWDEICSDNLPKMATLSRKWSRRAGAQGFWSREEARAQSRRYGGGW